MIDWSDRELATCVKIMELAEQAKATGPSASQRNKLQDILERCLELRDLVKVERYEVRKMLGEAKRFIDAHPSDFHAAEVEKISLLAKTKLQNIWNMLSDYEQAIRDALNFDLDETKLAIRKSVCLNIVCFKFRFKGLTRTTLSGQIQ